MIEDVVRFGSEFQGATLTYWKMLVETEVGKREVWATQIVTTACLETSRRIETVAMS